MKMLGFKVLFPLLLHQEGWNRQTTGCTRDRDVPGDDCEELLAVDSVHGEEGVESVRRNTVGEVEVLP